MTPANDDRREPEPGEFDGPAELTADDLRWMLDEQTPLERVDLLALTDAETLEYARNLQVECDSLRVLLRESLKRVQQSTAQLDAARRTIQQLRRAERRR